MSLSIRLPTLVTDMCTHLHKYRKSINNQTNFITGLKIITYKKYWLMDILIIPMKNQQTLESIIGQ